MSTLVSCIGAEIGITARTPGHTRSFYAAGDEQWVHCTELHQAQKENIPISVRLYCRIGGHKYNIQPTDSPSEESNYETRTNTPATPLIIKMYRA
jgi:hypothetical protein